MRGIRVADAHHTAMQEEPRLVVIRHYFNPFEAQLTLATLEAAGIPVFLQNENFANTVWTEAIAVGGVQVLVPEEFIAEAEAVLGQSTHVLSDEIPEATQDETPPPSFSRFVSACPACASSDLEFHQPLRRVAAALSFLSLPLVPPIKRYRCRSCGHVFPRQRGASPRASAE